jgi:hypothetical protein
VRLSLVPGAAIETAGGVKGLEASLGLRRKVPLPWKAESWERSGGRMPVREFANQKALIDYAERNGLVYLWETMPVAKRQRPLSTLAAFTKRQRLLSPDQYELVDVRTPYGVRRAMLFPKAILQAEFAANAPLREALVVKRARWRAKRAAKQEATVVS